MDASPNFKWPQLINRVIFVLSLAGIIMAIYVLQSFIRDASIICFSGSGCDLVRKSAASYIFGIPVPAFGLVGYSLLAFLSFIRTMSKDPRIILGMLGVVIFGVVFVTWFTLTEIFVIRGICSWCVLSAVNMYLLFVLVTGLFKQERKHHETH